MKRQKRELLPAWNMPSDPVKGVLWFLQWLLKVVVYYFWLPLIGMIIYELSINWRDGVGNAAVAAIGTLLVGLVVWALLYGLVLVLRVSAGVSQVISEATRIQQTLNSQQQAFRSFTEPPREPADESKVVEGSITDLDAERRKRRSE